MPAKDEARLPYHSLLIGLECGGHSCKMYELER
jgi:hypothetical protein